MSDLLDVEQVRAMATPAGALWAGERAPTALALARTALDWFARWSTVHAAEEARDLAIAERDEAYKQRDSALSRLDDAHNGRRYDVSHILGKTDEESQVGAARRVMAALAEARRERAGAERERDRLLRSEADVRTILGARPGEMLSDAAQRLSDEMKQIRHALNVPADETALRSVVWLKSKLAEFRADFAHQGSMLHEVARIAGLPDAPVATWGDVVAKVAALAAEAEPPQVFRPPISVTVSSAGGMTFAEVSVGDITDPGFLALSGHQLVRLGLVVCDG